MHQDVKTKWVKALRSGEYTQCRGTFRPSIGSIQYQENPNKYCCLAVLADLFIQENSDKYKWNNNYICDILGGTVGSSAIGVWQWAGLSDDQSNILVDMNDEELCSFEEIANYIDAQL